MRGLFQSERANMLRMSEVNAVDHQAMQHMLTEGSVDWLGFGQQIAREANDLLGGKDSVLIFDESGFTQRAQVPKKARHRRVLRANGMVAWVRWTTVRWVYLRACVVGSLRL
jgi:hypothetical protein